MATTATTRKPRTARKPAPAPQFVSLSLAIDGRLYFLTIHPGFVGYTLEWPFHPDHDPLVYTVARTAEGPACTGRDCGPECAHVAGLRAAGLL